MLATMMNIKGSANASIDAEPRHNLAHRVRPGLFRAARLRGHSCRLPLIYPTSPKILERQQINVILPVAGADYKIGLSAFARRHGDCR
jgi:hypothetical protein